MFPIQLFFAASVLLNLTPNVSSLTNETDREIIERILVDLKASDHPENLGVYPHIEHIYDKSGHQSIWDGRSKNAALEILGNAKIHGLDPSDYRYDELKNSNVESGSSYASLENDVLFTYGMLQFGRHMVEGRTNPEYFYSDWHYQRRQFTTSASENLLSAIRSGNLNQFLEHVMPEGGYYQGLMQWMKHYYSGDYNHKMITFDELPLKKGTRGSDVVELKYRLSQYGSYSGETPTDEFDDELEAAIIEFQTQMGLPSDGVVGKQTLAALNFSPEEKRDMVRINMERARWLLHDLPEKFLLVNIAGYELYIFDRLQKVYQTPVIVGKIHHETPLFHSDIQYIEFNCTWTVPRSISGEILASIKKNPDYLSSRHFEVLSNGRVVDPSTINWSQYSSSNVPFVFRQKPGPFNALGTMKFIFPNKYSVYLHDTPARYLFEKEGTRAFSHGCVRVKDPKALAAFILKDQDVSEGEIGDILETQETQRVYLEERLPVFLTYWTVYPEFPFNDPSTIHFVKDVYNRDEPILKALN